MSAAMSEHPPLERTQRLPLSSPVVGGGSAISERDSQQRASHTTTSQTPQVSRQAQFSCGYEGWARARVSVYAEVDLRVW